MIGMAWYPGKFVEDFTRRVRECRWMVECDELGYAYVRKKIPVDEVEFGERFPVALEERAEKYAELLRQGKELPPISVFGKRYPSDTYLVFDGHARLVAHRKLGLKEIDALITLVDSEGKSIKCEETEKIKKALTYL